MNKHHSWTRLDNGAVVTLKGAANAESAIARGVAERIRADVLREVPEATVTVLDYPHDRAVTITARITADDVAAVEQGPTHRAAIAKVRSVTGRASSWWEVAVSS